jgi:hypothetical protein
MKKVQHLPAKILFAGFKVDNYGPRFVGAHAYVLKGCQIGLD